MADDFNSLQEDDIIEILREILRKQKEIESKLLELVKRVSTLEG